MIKKIISGGQTGADRAALDWAIAHEVPHGGWCPSGREAEDGPLPNRYQLVELPNGGYRQRTKKNVLDSDGTLIINMGELSGGTQSTLRFAEQFKKPVMVINLDQGASPGAATQVHAWLRQHSIKVLNVAGPRESKRPGVYAYARQLLDLIQTTQGEPMHQRALNDPKMVELVAGRLAINHMVKRVEEMNSASQGEHQSLELDAP